MSRSPGPRPSAGDAHSALRILREARGLSQQRLAAAVGLSRQSLSAIEGGRATPAVDVALRIARALETTVEALFGAPPRAHVAVSLAGDGPHTRVAVGQVGERWVAHALRGEAARQGADGVVVGAGARRGAHEVELFGTAQEVQANLLMMGCAPGLGLLAARATGARAAGRTVWLAASTGAALSALAERSIHVAGLHVGADAGAGNLAALQALRGAGALTVVTFARWQEGLVLRANDARRIRGVEDLAQRGVRLIAREAGAGAQHLLEGALKRAGLPLRLARNPTAIAAGHLEVAHAVALGAADVGVATMDAALAYGLRFVPLAEERYDLALPSALRADPRILRLLDVVTSLAFRRELSAAGYDVAEAGSTIAEVTT